MKTVFFASAALAALIAAPAFAQDTTGSVGLSYQNNSTEVYNYDFDSDVLQLDGVVATPIFGDWTVTAAANVTYVDGDITGEETKLSGAVALTKAIGKFRVGGFYSGEEFYGTTVNTFGAVAQSYHNRMTFTGQLEYSTVYDIDAWSLKGDAAYYPTQNLRLNAGLQVQQIDTRWDDSEALYANIGAEYQIATSPYSVFANYTYTENDDTHYEENSIKVGLRYSFGGNLQARDRSGARIDFRNNYPISMIAL